MRPTALLIVPVLGILGFAGLIEAARERGYSAGFERDDRYAVIDSGAVGPKTAWGQSPAADARPLPDPRPAQRPSFLSSRADAVYLASPFAAGAVRPLADPQEAQVQIDLPDGRRMTVGCGPGRPAQACARRVAEAIDPTPPRDSVVEAEPTDTAP